MNIEDLNSLHRRAADLNQRVRDAACRGRHQRDEILNRRVNRTTLDEYMTACHELIFSGFAVETDTRELSLGYAEMPKDKPCPKLKPWVDFIDQQKLTFGKLYDALGSETRVFENRDVMERLWKGLSPRKPIGDETFLRFFMRDSFEKPVAHIISELAKIENVREAFGLEDGIEFTEKQDFVIDTSGAAYDGHMPFPCTPGSYVDRKDEASSAQLQVVCVVEWKLPHMLTTPRLRAGLREMDVFEEVANRESMLPACGDSTARFRYHAEKLTAYALTDAYDQMINEGLKYGLVTTGEATVLLKVNWDEPGTLYYHLAEFGPEVMGYLSDVPICTAVGQHLAFILMILGQQSQHTREERRRAVAGLKTWKADFVDLWRSIPESERWVSPENCLEPMTYEGVDRSPKFPASEECDDTLVNEDCDETLVNENESPESSGDESTSWVDLGDGGDWSFV
ncbi:hypothetical protein BHE90_012162 [Fusarium euwallaceae]|uniref:Uncharacterized protein n=1 Tax=Fusarium euwallaceae TaxID=1147111 RepID=A0A430LCE7_9HYPO|nr:hypothetical protein BHE90_012162 [Fusarium euwallaceae]